jgi:HSP20 family protein
MGGRQQDLPEGGAAMALERWRSRGLARSPFRELAREMEETFGRFFPAWSEERSYAWLPAVDMVDEKDELVVKADLPGLDQKDIEVTVQDGTLTIRGERKEEREEEKKEDYYYAERSYGAFTRSLTLPKGVEAAEGRAAFSLGLRQPPGRP